MKATFTGNKDNGRNLNGAKEVVNAFRLIALDSTKNDMVDLIDCRLYMARKSDGASPVYCSVWINDSKSGTHTAGYGKASGYGYHKESAAVQGALTSAGVEMWGSAYSRHDDDDETKRAYIDGAGESAIKKAFEAIALSLGYTVFKVI